MNRLRLLAAFILATSVLALSVSAQDKDHNQMEVQQHGTTMMHTSPSDEEDMSHTMHESSVNSAIKKSTPQKQDDHHAGHDMGSAQHDQGEHAHHEKSMDNKTLPTSVSLKKLNKLPPSGKSREANFDGTYYMHSTSHNQTLEIRCALASRGLVMLDNKSWAKCGGKPVGWSAGIAPEQQGEDHSQHMDH